MASYDEEIHGDIDASRDVLVALNDLCMSECSADVTFIVEKMKIPAHKLILSARSEYFQALFHGGFAEASKSEIELDDPLDAFKAILRFIYTGQMTLTSLDIRQLIDVFALADRYNFETLQEKIQKYLTSKLTVANFFEIWNALHLHGDAQNALYTFADRHAAGLIKHDSFKSISSDLLCILLKRDTFYAPEVDIFHAVQKWCENNPNEDAKAPLSLIRWFLISPDHLMDIVMSNNIMDPGQFMKLVKQKRDDKKHRIEIELGENFATEKYGARTTRGENSWAILDGDFKKYDEYKGFSYHIIDDDSKSIVVDLGKIRNINYIEMLLYDLDGRAYGYYIDVSIDGIEYKGTIDYTNTYCRSWQFLHFPSCAVRFIKLVGVGGFNMPRIKHCKNHAFNRIAHRTFNVVGLKAMCIEVSGAAAGILRPLQNVALPKLGAIVHKGAGGNNMLNCIIDEFTCHTEDGYILLQLNQPRYINSLRMLLGYGRSSSDQYSFYIETSMDNEEWQMALDKRDEILSGWQQLKFDERLVTFVRIVGTKVNDKGIFVCTYFECPCNPSKPNLFQRQ